MTVVGACCSWLLLLLASGVGVGGGTAFDEAIGDKER